MNSDQQLDALLRATRDHRPATEKAEYGFETRLAARLREEQRSAWIGLGWRLSPFFAALVLAAAAWCYQSVSLDADPTYALDAFRSGGTSALTAWLPESDQ